MLKAGSLPEFTPYLIRGRDDISFEFATYLRKNPYFLLKLFQRPGDSFKHAGSIDIDIVIDSTRIPQDEYATIVERINARGYTERKSRTGVGIPFSFERNIGGLKIAVDFLSGEYGGTSKEHRLKNSLITGLRINIDSRRGESTTLAYQLLSCYKQQQPNTVRSYV